MAKLQQNMEESGRSKSVVLALYDALSSRHMDTVHSLLAPNLEWWFHGPPSHQFMMRLLTGTVDANTHSFQFTPVSIAAFGSTVLVEGCDQSRSICWVQAWTVTGHRRDNYPVEGVLQHLPYRYRARPTRFLLSIFSLTHFPPLPFPLGEHSFASVRKIRPGSRSGNIIKPDISD